ncbi:DUF309 domain-containing protein [Blastopirellula sp. J2-11]|uniref:DUF309 domain-containing protein n=1 Tax=Blastopirellula sp. J2-11 TaxID=2943192 RepID=UPI0021C7C09E|nr:DUF309 domain-containing protein [Blastopirellula sp. J2-11]UUO04845.1 DUF309 domain-containing protein [Blastopirellula sp. J2-11]
MNDSVEYDPRYLEGIRLFNDCEYFEAHDVWEELWADSSGEVREFYQGLIQTAVCLHHFVNENTRGAVKLFHSSRNYLGKYRPEYLGLDLELLFTEMENCCREIVASTETYPVGVIDVEKIPDLRHSAAIDEPNSENPD